MRVKSARGRSTATVGVAFHNESMTVSLGSGDLRAQARQPTNNGWNSLQFSLYTGNSAATLYIGALKADLLLDNVAFTKIEHPQTQVQQTKSGTQRLHKRWPPEIPDGPGATVKSPAWMTPGPI